MYLTLSSAINSSRKPRELPSLGFPEILALRRVPSQVPQDEGLRGSLNHSVSQIRTAVLGRHFGSGRATSRAWTCPGGRGGGCGFSELPHGEEPGPGSGHLAWSSEAQRPTPTGSAGAGDASEPHWAREEGSQTRNRVRLYWGDARKATKALGSFRTSSGVSQSGPRPPNTGDSDAAGRASCAPKHPSRGKAESNPCPRSQSATTLTCSRKPVRDPDCWRGIP